MRIKFFFLFILFAIMFFAHGYMIINDPVEVGEMPQDNPADATWWALSLTSRLFAIMDAVGFAFSLGFAIKALIDNDGDEKP